MHATLAHITLDQAFMMALAIAMGTALIAAMLYGACVLTHSIVSSTPAHQRNARINARHKANKARARRR